MVNEIIVVFLGTLPLDRHPESKPFTPLRRPRDGHTRVTPAVRRIIPGARHTGSRARTQVVTLVPARLPVCGRVRGPGGGPGRRAGRTAGTRRRAGRPRPPSSPRRAP